MLAWWWPALPQSCTVQPFSYMLLLKLQVQLARIDCLRRKGQEAYGKTREAFQAAQELLGVYFPDWMDRTLQLTSYRADTALRLGRGIEEARDVWNAALKSPAGRYCNTPASLTTRRHTIPKGNFIYDALR